MYTQTNIYTEMSALSLKVHLLPKDLEMLTGGQRYLIVGLSHLSLTVVFKPYNSPLDI